MPKFNITKPNLKLYGTRAILNLIFRVYNFSKNKNKLF
ncbi:hypothetical protein UNSWCD_1707 [Campylobacter concisus UNSWCD]|nr:hypothetical protein UNSWCD_1707 [Campylobacter concisus UNSWCD]